MPPEPVTSAAAVAPAVRALTCPNCGGTVNLRAAGYTVTVACQYCGSVLDVADPAVKLLDRYNHALEEPEISLGTRGTLRGVEWEAIGYLRRSEGGYYPWEEYLLFNPYHGYRWLVNVRGGWSFGEMLTSIPDTSRFGDLNFDGKAYSPFFRNGHARVDYVLGEFYWRVTVGETVDTDDFVRPGTMLSREANANEVSWTRNELLEPGEIRAFGVRPEKPWPPLPHQRSPYAGWFGTAGKVALGAVAFLLVFFFVFSSSQVVARATLPIAADERDQNATVSGITLTRPWQSVEIRAQVPRLENGWVDLDYSLVNRATQQSYVASGAAERYSGSDSDGPWTEGSRTRTMTIASVPAGTYDLVIEFDGKRWVDPAVSISSWGTNTSGWADADNQPQLEVEVRQGGVSGGNLLFALILIPLPLLLALWRHVRFEQARQDESDVGRSGMAALFTSNSDDD